MKIILTTLSFLASILTVQAQQLSIDHSSNSDSLLLNKITVLRNDKDYASIIDLLLKSEVNDTLWQQYQLACYYSLNMDSTNSYCYLLKAIQNDADLKNVLTDTDFNFLHHTYYWKAIDDKIDETYFSEYPSISHKQISVELWRMGIEDQRYRTLRKNFKLEIPKEGTVEKVKFDSLFSIDLKAREERLMEIIKDYGFPSIDMVGEESSSAALGILLHTPRKMMKKHYRKIKRLAKKNQVCIRHYAMITDRLLLLNMYKKQIYGTQCFVFFKPTESGDVPFYCHYPVKDEKNLDRRRRELGLEPIADYLKDGFGIEYKYNEENDDKTAHEILEEFEKSIFEEPAD